MADCQQGLAVASRVSDAPGTEQLKLFCEERLPRRPYCSEDKTAKLIRPLHSALSFPYIQVNPPHLRFWMPFDIDRAGGGLAWEDANLPMPAWAAINKENAHAHIAWGLSAAVLTGDGARDAPLRYLCAVESAYRDKLQADHGYSGLITKNPLHPLWRVFCGTPHLYDLAELSEYVDIDRHRPKRGKVEEVGLGRNCTLFDWLRQWAYEAVRRHRDTRNYVLWQAEAYDKALERNGDFVYPLDPRECWHIAKSVAKWTWRKDADVRAKFIDRQRRKGQKGGVASGLARLSASENKRASARLMALQGLTQAAIAAGLGVTDRTVRTWLAKNGTGNEA